MSYRGRYDDGEDDDEYQTPNPSGAGTLPTSRYDDIPSTSTRRTMSTITPQDYAPSPLSLLPSLREHNLSSIAPSVISSRAFDTQSTISHARGYQQIEKRMEQLKLETFATRPGYGTVGKPLEVMTNYFQVRPWNNERPKVIHHYDVTIDPVVKVLNQKKPKALMRAVWEQLVLEHREGHWVEPFSASAFDGRKNAYSPIPFPLHEAGEQTFTVAVNADGIVQRPGHTSSSDEEQRRWRITIKQVATIDLQAVIEFCTPSEGVSKVEEECLTGLMATNVLLRDLPSKKYAQVGAAGNRFFSSEGAVPIAHGAVVCKGFMQSFRYSNSGLPVLNLDVGYSAFIASGPAIDVISKILGPNNARGRGGYMGGIQPGQSGHGLTTMSERDVAIAKSKLRGAKFTVTHRNSNRLHTIMSITLQPAEAITFLMNAKEGEESKRITIPQYYKQYYGCEVTRPRLPCVQYGKKSFVPLEFVELKEWNSLPPLKLSPDQTAEMIKISAASPRDRSASIQKWRKELAYEQQEKIRQWGLQINKNMMRVQARVLPPPRVLYAGGRDTVRPVEGSWNIRSKEFYRNAKRPLKAWSVISFDRYTDTDEMKRYMIYLMSTLRNHGVVIENQTPALIGPVNPMQPGAVRDALQKAARTAYEAGKIAPQLICVVLPGRDAFLYEQIKRISFMDLKAPVPTQCMQAVKIRSPRSIEAYTGNLVMKIQSKLGGVTHQVPLSDLPGMVKGKTMLLGGNLGFPPTRFGQFEGAPTVACTIATFNADCDAYSAQIRLQEGRSETIADLASMIKAHLDIFAKQNGGTYPDRILIFRDGISEGQYRPVLTYEHDAVLKACAKIRQGYRPKLLICICAKRHSTRFFGRDTDVDRSGNLPSGLVVDSSVTHPYTFDFFMQSHQGRVGTARPTHYVCLLDEIGLTPDQLQQTVHGLCFTFARCTKSVSLVPVCYVADLVCQKARIIVHEPNLGNSAPSESSHGGTNTTRSMFRKAGGELDVMQIQRLLEKNPELGVVGWWM